MLNVRIKTLTRALAEGREVNLKYRNARGIVSKRSVEPSHLYESTEGKLVVVAYDDLRDEYRHFRLDRMLSCRIAKPVEPELVEGKVKVRPASYKLRLAEPQIVSRESAEAKYLPKGWTITPVVDILRQ
jgi:predicted DNA-binding transcriptional regulator YafY